MKRMKLWIVAAAMVCCGMGMFTSCQDGNKADAGKQTEETELSPAEVEEAARLKAINRFLVDSIGKHYESGEVCIPCVHIVGTEEQDSDAMMVWGDFWVFNYNVEADTLMMVSGGDHPGLMRLNKFDNGYMVTGFEQVGDGSDFDPSARRLFGLKYGDFHKINSDQEAREKERARSIADYVKENNLTVKFYKDYGWPAVAIPAEENPAKK